VKLHDFFSVLNCLSDIEPAIGYYSLLLIACYLVLWPFS